MYRVLIFGGTTEGRLLYTYCVEHTISALVCVATEYGERLLVREGENSSVGIHEGRLTLPEMQELMRREKPQLVLDATHPYAVLATENIKAACDVLHITYKRILRSDTDISEMELPYGDSGIYSFDSIEKAVCFLEKQDGNIFVTTGSKELIKYKKLTAFQDRVYVRILPQPELVASCIALGIEGRHLAAMQGPFSEEMNYAYLTEFGIRWMVTKQSGAAGGFPEKCKAAERAGVNLVMIRRKEKENGIPIEEAKRLLEEME